MLRTEGEGDYIRAIADAILGTSANPFARCRRLGSENSRTSFKLAARTVVRRALEAAGATAVTHTNVRQ
jgi:hypothetical protein